MAQPLQGKIIAITGAASGIANAVAKECAARGASLALADLSIDVLNSVVSDLQSQYPNQDFIGSQLNVTDSASVDAWIASAVDRFGHLDGAANIAGVETKPGCATNASIVDMTDDHWKFVHDVNLNGVFYCVRAQMRVMKRGGSIVNAASTGGLRGAPNLGAYISSKHGVVGLTKSAAKEGGANGIRVNAVCPGPIETLLLRRIFEHTAGMEEAVVQGCAMKRLGKVEEIAKIFCYLLGDDSSWITATTITADGGALSA